MRRAASGRPRGEAELLELRTRVDGGGRRVVKDLSAVGQAEVVRGGPSLPLSTCAHCKRCATVREDALLHCESEHCPAAYHEYCIDAAVAAAVAQRPELLSVAILCPLCALKQTLAADSQSKG